MMKGRALILVVIFILVATLSGCAGSRTYLIDVRYIPTEQRPTAAKLERVHVVGICPFEDARKERVKDTIGIRKRTGNMVDFLKVAGTTVSESVTQAVKDYYAASGFQVTECKGWDGSPEALATLPQDLSLVVAGTIESFMVDARSGIPTTEIRYRLKMAVSIGQVADGKVVIRTIDSAPQTRKMTFDPGQVAAIVNQTLTEAIRNLLK